MTGNTTVDNLSVQFGADFRELIAEYKKAGAETQKWRAGLDKEFAAAKNSVDKLVSGFRGTVATIAGALGIGFGTKFFIDLAKGTGEWASQVEQLARNMQTTSGFIQGFTAAGREARLTEQEVLGGLNNLSVRISEMALGRGKGRDIFQALGLDPALAEKPLNEIVAKISAALQRFNRPSQLAIIRQLFNVEEAQKWLDLLGKGPEHIERAVRAFEASGRAIPTKEAAEMHEKWKEITAEVDSELRRAIIELGPVITGTLKILTSFLKETREFVEWLEGKRASVPGGRDLIARMTAEERAKAGLPPRPMQGRLGVLTDMGIGAPGRDGSIPPESRLTPEQRAYLSGTAGMPVRSGTAKLPSREGLSLAEEYRKLLIDLDAEFTRATKSIDPYGAALGDLEAKLAKMKRTLEGSPEAAQKFNAAWGAKATADLQVYGRETEHIVEMGRAELANDRELMAVLQARYEFAKRFGQEELQRRQAEIDAAARLRFAVEENIRIQKQAMDELRGIVGDAVGTMTSNFGEFFDKNKKGWDIVKERAFSVLNSIMNRIQQMALNDLFRALGLGGTGPGLGGFFSFLGGGAGANAPQLGLLPTLAEGGPVSAGRPYIVGERRPELFIPDVSGTIVPRVPGGGVTYIDARGADQVALARLEAIVKAQGQEVRAWQAAEPARVVSHVIDARRRGGAAGNALKR